MTGTNAHNGSGEDFRLRVRFDAPREAVYDAAARPGGEAGWWTTDGGVAAEEDALLRLNWRDGDHIVFRLDRLRRPELMEWSCVEQRDRNLPRADEWVGTTLRFGFAEEGEGTVLDFVHVGLSATLECFEICRPGWEFFLRSSLAGLVDSGVGRPHEAA
jgi:uncharacterized protein YndB with AHSA1/START domain